MKCIGDCNQGRRLCVTPHACGLTANPPDEEPYTVMDAIKDGLLSMAIIIILVFTVFVGIGFWSARIH